MQTIKTSIIALGGLLLMVITLVILTQVNYRYSVNHPGGNDFLARWMGARFWLLKGISPYDTQVSQATQMVVYGRLANKYAGEDIGHFVYPLTAMVFFAPFGLIGYLQARAIWMTFLEISIFLLGILSVRLIEWKTSTLKLTLLVVFSVIWYHGVRTILLGQFAAIEALLIVISLLMIQKQSDFAGGLFLALATSKPQMVYLLIIFVLLWSISVRRYEILWGFLIVGGLLLVISLVFIPDWPLQMLRQLLDYPSYTQTVSTLSIIASSLPGIKNKLSLILHGIFISYMLVEWFRALRKNYSWFIWTALLTLVLTNFVTIRIATTNYLMLLPVVFLVSKNIEGRWGRLGRILVWMWIGVMIIGLWWLFLTTIHGNIESPFMYLPLPIFCLFGLWWVRWWYFNPPRVLLDRMQVGIE